MGGLVDAGPLDHQEEPAAAVAALFEELHRKGGRLREEIRTAVDNVSGLDGGREIAETPGLPDVGIIEGSDDGKCLTDSLLRFGRRLCGKSLLAAGAPERERAAGEVAPNLRCHPATGLMGEERGRRRPVHIIGRDDTGDNFPLGDNLRNIRDRFPVHIHADGVVVGLLTAGIGRSRSGGIGREGIGGLRRDPAAGLEVRDGELTAVGVIAAGDVGQARPVADHQDNVLRILRIAVRLERRHVGLVLGSVFDASLDNLLRRQRQRQDQGKGAEKKVFSHGYLFGRMKRLWSTGISVSSLVRRVTMVMPMMLTSARMEKPSQIQVFPFPSMPCWLIFSV